MCVSFPFDVSEKGAYGSLEVIEVSGAWKASNEGKSDVKGSSIDEGTQTQNAGKHVHSYVPKTFTHAVKRKEKKTHTNNNILNSELLCL